MGSITLTRKVDVLAAWGDFTDITDAIAALEELRTTYGVNLHGTSILFTLAENDVPRWQISLPAADNQSIYVGEGLDESAHTYLVWNGRTLTTYSPADLGEQFSVTKKGSR